MINFSVYLAEVDVVQQFRPSQSLVQFLVNMMIQNPAEEESHTATDLKIDLFFAYTVQDNLLASFFLIHNKHYDDSSFFASLSQDTMTPPPEA